MKIVYYICMAIISGLFSWSYIDIFVSNIKGELPKINKEEPILTYIKRVKRGKIFVISHVLFIVGIVLGQYI